MQLIFLMLKFLSLELSFYLELQTFLQQSYTAV